MAPPNIPPLTPRVVAGIARPVVKPSAAKKVIKYASPSESSTSAAGTQPQSDKAEDVLLEAATMADLVENVSTASGRGDSGSFPAKSGSDSPPATKVRGSRFSLRVANKSFKTVRPNKLVDLSPEKENTPTPVASPVRYIDIDDFESVAADVSMIDDDLENELLAKLDMLADPAVKSESVVDKGKPVMEEEPEADVPTQEQISVAILTLQELIDGDPSHFCQVPEQQVAFQAAGILSRAPHLSSSQRKFWADFATIFTHFSRRFRVLENKVAAADSVRKSVEEGTAAVFKKKEEFLAAKITHVAQVKHLQELKEEISNLEAKLVELRNQVPLAEQMEKDLAEQRNKLRGDMEAGLKSVSKIKDQLPSFTASANEAAEELKHMKEEWASWQNNFC